MSVFFFFLVDILLLLFLFLLLLLLSLLLLYIYIYIICFELISVFLFGSQCFFMGFFFLPLFHSVVVLLLFSCFDVFLCFMGIAVWIDAV